MNCLRKRWISILLATISAGLAGMAGFAPVSAQSLPDTVQAINKSRVATRILFITAHPDDESAGLLAYLSRGLDADVALLTVTRGQGGQNAIGPEQDGQLGVIRTEELLAAGKAYGVRQFFTRAVDSGFSKSPQETMKKWGDVPLEDIVRVIRIYRPQVVINGWGGVHSGHGQHQATGILVPQAVAAAADPNAFSGQIAEGLPAWKVTLELRGARGNTSSAVEIPVNGVSPLWGTSYTDIGIEGHERHRSQGTPGLFGNSYFRRPTYLVTEKGDDNDTGTFDAKLLAEPITSLADRFPGLRDLMAPALQSASQDIAEAAEKALALDRAAAANSLAEAGKQVAALRDQVAKQSGNQKEAAVWELDQVRQRINTALADDVALPVQANADRHELVAGESFTVNVNFQGQPAVPVKWTLAASNVVVPAGWTAAEQGATEAGGSAKFTVSVPPDATVPSSPAYAVLPFPPPLVKLTLPVEVDGYEFEIEKPFESVAATTTGINTYSLELTPAVTLTIEPRQVMAPVNRVSEPVTLLARVRYHGTASAKVSVEIDAPDGWKIPSIAPLDFSGPGDQLIRFVVTPAARIAPGAYPLHPFARIGDRTFRTSLEPIPTLPTRDWSEPDDVTVHSLNLAIPAGLRIGYIAADNDPLPEVLRQLGIRVDMLDEVALAFDDLSRYDAIVAGIRAYELRPDLSRSNRRLLDYVQNGGALLVQYQRNITWNTLLPFPGTMTSATARVTDPNSPVRFLAPESPLLNAPNKITMADFQGWVQERGLYFWNTVGAPYQAVLGLTDAAEPETNGGLVYARDGKGVYIYTGLSFFRELPAGVPGAYRLFINLLSQTRHAHGGD